MEKIRLLGSGGQAKIFLVKIRGHLYACKESHNTKNLERESSFLRMMDHERFVRFVDYLEEDKKGILIMEYIAGCNLGRLMCGQGLERKKTIEVLLAAAEGIAYLHSMKRPILHRDIKPENIMITPEGSVKLIDLGCACFEGAKEKDAAGTKGYAPAEQVNGEGTPGAYSDVYAFGRMMHFLLTGDNPYLPPLKKPDVRHYDHFWGRDLAELVEACVREEPENRPPDMRYVLHELERIAAQRKIWKIFIQRGRGICRSEFVYEKNILIK